MQISLPHIRQAIQAMPWAILPDRATDIMAVIERRIAGERLSPEQVAAIKGPREMPNGILLQFDGGAISALDSHDDASERPRSRDAAATIQVASRSGTVGGAAVGVINIHGVIAQHARQVDNVSGPGGTSCERVSLALRQALADPNIGSILFNIDIPGGNVFGVQALAEEILAARGKKRMVAQANSLMASAAYWIGSAADEIVVTPGGQVGSIGVVALHEDWSGAAEKVGVKYTFITAGKYKVEGNSFEPLGEEARSAIQADVDAYYRDFVRGVAKARGVAVRDVLDGFGQARTVKDGDAVKEKMADRVATLDSTLNRMLRGAGAGGNKRAQVPGFTAAELGEEGSLYAAFLGNPAKNVYHVGTGPVSAVHAVEDTGKPLTFGGHDWPDRAALENAVVAAGTYHTCLAEGLIRIGASPVGPVTARVPQPNDPDERDGQSGSTPPAAPQDGQQPAEDASASDAPADPPAPPVAPDSDADAAARERDAYRRRRHAHLMRQQ